MIKNSILTFLLILSLTGYLFGQDLNQSISINATDKSLEEILNLISDKYDVSFSYLNNDLPLNKVDVDFEGISLDHALSNLLDGFGYDHISKSGKIIIKKATPIAEDESKVLPTDTIPEEEENPEPEEDSENPNQNIVLGGTQPDQIETESSPEIEEISTNEQEPEEEYAPVKRYNPGSGVLITYKSGDKKEEVIEYEDPGPIQRLFSQEEDSIDEESLKTRVAHAGLFYPFSTNGYNAKNYVNNLSFHLISGLSGGLEGFEFAGVASIIKGNADGIQISGIANLVNGSMNGGQFAGITNITWYDFEGVQAAGIANISYDRNLGAQIAGISNISKGAESGFQAAGITNISYGRSRFGQLSGIYNSAWAMNGIQASCLVNNVSRMNGAQVAGLYNQAGKIYGAQVSGFINRVGEIQGAQIAPFLNIAKKVKGVQIGLINISDEMHGTPIGLFCLAKRNGYFDLEVFYSDDFQANMALKVGAPHFHNIFAFSYETDYKNRWAYGYGFGSQWGRGDVRLNTDIISYYVVEDEFPNGGFQDFELNLLSRFRLLPSFHLGDFGIFAGPTLNFMASEHMDPESGVIGSDITPKPLYETTNEFQNINYKLWIGYHVGIRI